MRKSLSCDEYKAFYYGKEGFYLRDSEMAHGAGFHQLVSFTMYTP